METVTEYPLFVIIEPADGMPLSLAATWMTDEWLSRLSLAPGVAGVRLGGVREGIDRRWWRNGVLTEELGRDYTISDEQGSLFT